MKITPEIPEGYKEPEWREPSNKCMVAVAKNALIICTPDGNSVVLTPGLAEDVIISLAGLLDTLLATGSENPRPKAAASNLFPFPIFVANGHGNLN